MGAKPKAVGASSTEIAAGEVARSSYRRWKEKYSPLLKAREEATQNDSVDKTLSGQANAKVMQTLTSKPTLDETQSVDPAGRLAAAQQGQQAAAHKVALGVKNAEGAAILGQGQGLAGTATQGLAMAAKLESARKLNEASNKQAEQQAAFNATTKVAATFAGQAYNNASMAGVAKTGKIGEMDWSKAFTPQQQVAGTTEGGVGSYEAVTPWQGLWNAFGKGKGK